MQTEIFLEDCSNSDKIALDKTIISYGTETSRV